MNITTLNNKQQTTNNKQQTINKTMSTTKTLADYAITYKMSVASFRPTRSVKEIKRQTCEHFKLKSDKSATGTIYLILPEFTDPLAEKVREIRRFFTENTLRLGTIDIIPSKNYFRIAEYMRTTGPVFDALSDDFRNRWVDEIRPKSMQALGLAGKLTSGDKVWGLSPDDLKERIYFKFSQAPMGDYNTIANMEGLTDDLREGFKKEMEEQNAKIEEAATQQLAERLRKELNAFATKFSTYKDKHSRVSESIITNITDLADLIPDLVVNEDTSLIELAEEAKMLGQWDTDILRENEGARKQAVNTAKDILGKMKF